MAWVAGQQLEVITTAQLYAAGLSRDAIRIRRRRGTLHLRHRGVYLFGGSAPRAGAPELAAVLACGDSAVVSHRSAAALWSVFPSVPSDEIDVTVIGSNRRDRRGIRIHRVSELDPADRRLRRGIPVTSPARTLLDFAAQAEPDELEQAIAEAYALRLTDEVELRRQLHSLPHRTGAGLLGAELDREEGPAYSRSEAERRMKRLLRQARLPPAMTNVLVAGVEPDFLWPEQRLVVEVDGFQFHGHRAAFERDRRKELVLVRAGYRVIRISWRQLTGEPLMVAATLAVALQGSRVRD